MLAGLFWQRAVLSNKEDQEDQEKEAAVAAASLMGSAQACDAFTRIMILSGLQMAESTPRREEDVQQIIQNFLQKGKIQKVRRGISKQMSSRMDHQASLMHMFEAEVETTQGGEQGKPNSK